MKTSSKKKGTKKPWLGLLGGILLVFSMVLPTFAAAPISTGTISLITTDPHFGGHATFEITVDKKYDCTGWARCARVELLCYKGDLLVYGEAGSLLEARTGIYNAFIFGGGSSDWVAQGGGDALCHANLFRFDNSGKVQTYVFYNTTGDFAVAG